MKSQERHKLKENEFARTVAQVREVLASRAARHHVGCRRHRRVCSRSRAGTRGGDSSTAGRGTELLATALAVYEAPVVPVAAPAPGSPAPVQQPGTYATEQAKLEAALPKFIEAADKYPSTDGRHRRQVSRGVHPRVPRPLQRGGAALPGSRGKGGQRHLRADRPAGACRRAGRTEEVRHCNHDLYRR